MVLIRMSIFFMLLLISIGFSAYQQIDLDQGPDGIVDIYLNGQWITLHSNMYMPVNVYVTDYLVNENVPPSGAVYDPENNGTPLQSLGVHEHWNNPRDRQYSRYPGRKSGIERVSVMI